MFIIKKILFFMLLVPVLILYNTDKRVKTRLEYNTEIGNNLKNISNNKALDPILIQTVADTSEKSWLEYKFAKQYAININ